MRKHITLIAFVLFTHLACKKDNQIIKDELSLLTSKSWKLALKDKNLSSNPSANSLYYARLDCQQDDIYQFSKDGKLTISNGKQKCDPGESGSAISDYSIDLDSKKITINHIVYSLAELSQKQLKYYAIIPTNTGFSELVFVYEH